MEYWGGGGEAGKRRVRGDDDDDGVMVALLLAIYKQRHAAPPGIFFCQASLTSCALPCGPRRTGRAYVLLSFLLASSPSCLPLHGRLHFLELIEEAKQVVVRHDLTGWPCMYVHVIQEEGCVWCGGCVSVHALGWVKEACLREK
jgi:hypothetical protein